MIISALSTIAYSELRGGVWFGGQMEVERMEPGVSKNILMIKWTGMLPVHFNYIGAFDSLALADRVKFFQRATFVFDL